MGRISLPTEIVQSDRTPRTAIAFDRSSGVKQIPDGAKEVLLVGQSVAGGLAVAGIPTPLTREDDGALYFGAGSMIDIACRAAFKAYSFVLMTAVGIADAGVKATATLTFATNASGSTIGRVRIMGIEVAFDVTLNDTPTIMGDSFVAALAAVHAKTPLPVTAVNVTGTVTLTARNGGVVGNGIQLRLGGLGNTGFDQNVTSTATLSGAAMGSATPGTGTASPTTALAAATGKRYHLPVDLIGDATSGALLRTHTDTESDAEHDHGEIFAQAVNTTQSASTTQALALNALRGTLAAINGCENWTVQIAAAYAAVLSSEENPARPYNTLVLNGIKAPPIEKRWTRLETRILLANGVSPLVVIPGDKVAIMRAVSMGVKDTGGNYDYTTLDINKFQVFDFFRDAITLMFATNYPRALWADSDPDGLLPSDVATPDKVLKDLLDVARDMEALGFIQNVTALEDQFVVEKVDDQCVFSVPAAIVDGMHRKYGKIVNINRPLAGQG